MNLRATKRDLVTLVVGAAIASVLISPAGAHVTTSVTHLWTKHVKPQVTKLVYTKAQSDARYLGKTAKAVDADKLDGKNSSEFSPLTETWRVVGAAGQPGFNLGDFQLVYDLYGGDNPYSPGDWCSWGNFDSSHQSAAFRTDADKVVHLAGLVKATHGSAQSCGSYMGQDGGDLTIFRLPPGYRPAVRVVLNTMSFAKIMRVDIDPNGMVSLGSEGNFHLSDMEQARNWVTLDGLSFPAA